MAEYIERGTEYVELTAAISAAVRYFQSKPNRLLDMYELMNSINDVPAADVVEVVRCKDCKHAYMPPPKRKNAEWCSWHETEVGNDDFCSYGEKRK